jgi:hypothetical protein
VPRRARQLGRVDAVEAMGAQGRPGSVATPRPSATSACITTMSSDV